MGWLKLKKNRISWEQNIIFLRNKKILYLCFRKHILRSYRFVAEVTFKYIEFIVYCFPDRLTTDPSSGCYIVVIRSMVSLKISANYFVRKARCKIRVFIIFISFFDKKSNFRNRIILHNQKQKMMLRNC